MRRLVILSLLVLLPAAAGCREPLTWRAPAIDRGATVIQVPPSGGNWSGNRTDRDCEVRLPKVAVYGQVKVSGCHDLKLVGGEFSSNVSPCSAQARGAEDTPALYISDFSGTAHIEGVKIHGRGFSDGLWLTSTLPNSVGEVEGSWFGRFAACREPQTGFIGGWPDEHPDCLQTWAGPAVLRLDKVTCWTVYDGLTLDPNNWTGAGGRKYRARSIDIRRTDVHLNERAPNGRHCFATWSPYTPLPTHFDRVSCSVGSSGFAPLEPRPELSRWWSGVRLERLGASEISPAEAGLRYRAAAYVG